MALEEGNGVLAHNDGEVSKVVFTAVKPWLVVEAEKASEAVEFYKAALGAEEISRVNNPKRKAEQELPLVVSAELKLGSSSIVVSDLAGDAASDAKSTASNGFFCLETVNVEAAVSKAVAAGAVADGEIADGDGTGRVARVKDPYGNVWQISEPSKKAGDIIAA